MLAWGTSTFLQTISFSLFVGEVNPRAARCCVTLRGTTSFELLEEPRSSVGTTPGEVFTNEFKADGRSADVSRLALRVTLTVLGFRVVNGCSC